MRVRAFAKAASMLALVVAMAAGGASMASAQPGPGGPGGPRGFGRFGGPGGPGGPGEFFGLGLTDQQREQIRALYEQHKTELQAAREAVRTARDAQEKALDAATLDEGAVRAAATQLASAEADMLILNAKIKAEAVQLLTPDQLAKLQERKAERARMKAEFESRRQQKQQPPQ